MSKREVIRSVIEGKRPPYVPWNIGLTKEAREKLERHFGDSDMEMVLDNHFLRLGSDIGFFTDLGENRFEDVFGVIWDRSIDKDIGTVSDVSVETNRLLELGSDGNYIFAPAHDVEGDVPLENLLTFIEIIQNQTGYRA